jgi:hypothetical protein
VERVTWLDVGHTTSADDTMCKTSVVVVSAAITQSSVQVPHFQIAGSEYAKEDVVYYAVVQSTAIQVQEEGVHVLQHDDFHTPG